MNLKKRILDWDGKSADAIGLVYETHSTDDDFVLRLIRYLNDPELEVGSSWLIKKHLDNGNEYDSAQVSAIYQSVRVLRAWEAKLHILQSMPAMPVPEIQKERVESFLRNCLAEKNKFVRAWAYGGFYQLADQFPEYRDEARLYIENAMIEEPASVKARIRNSIKKGFMAE